MTEMPFVNVDDWKDVAAILIIVIGGWVSTFITLRRGQKRAHRSHDDLNAKVDGIKDQVVNGHQIPLRQDIDEMRGVLGVIRDELHIIRRDIRSVHSDMSGIREELGVERTARTDLEHRMDDEMGPRQHRHRKPST